MFKIKRLGEPERLKIYLSKTLEFEVCVIVKLWRKMIFGTNNEKNLLT